MNNPRIEAAAAAMWEPRPMMRTVDGASLAHGARFRGLVLRRTLSRQAEVALAATDAVDPLLGDGVIAIRISDEHIGDVVHNYTFSPYGNDSDDSN